MKKINLKIVLTIFLLLTFIATISRTTYNDVTMSVVEDPVCTINFATASSVEKKLISKDLANKEVTIQLNVSNNETSMKPTGEIMLVIDNSNSMLNTVSGTTTRKKLVINSAKTLIKNLLEDNTKLKIGIVSFSAKTIGDGTIEDAKLVSNLSNNAETLISAISNIGSTGPKTNLDAGIQLAKKYFTAETDNFHKYMIILTDGVPNIAVNYDHKYFSDDVISKTKTSLQSLSTITKNNVYTMLTGITNGNATAGTSGKTYNQIIQSIFGTEQNPTIGKFYYIKDSNIENTIKNDIYNNLLPSTLSFNDIIITDVFPKEIVDNFAFSYVKEANIGNISTSVDKSNNSIAWTIPELKSGETAIVQYKLKLNTNYDNEIINKVLNTNTKLDLSYKDYSGVTNTKSSDISPKIKLTETKEESPKEELPKEESPKKESPKEELPKEESPKEESPKEESPKEESPKEELPKKELPKEELPKKELPKEELPKELPKAGASTLFNCIGLMVVVSIIFGIRYLTLKNKIK